MNNVIMSRFKFFRNVKDFKFVNKLENEKKDELVELINKNFLAKVDAKSIDKNKYFKQVGDFEFLYSLLDGEHINISCSCLGFNKEAFIKAKQEIDLLSNSIQLGYSDDYGFLMSDLTKIGSGLRIEADFDLAGLKRYEKINQVKQNIEKLGYILTEKYNNIYTLSTSCNLGYSTEEIFDDFSKMVTKLQDLEIESEKLLYASNSDVIIDKALRAEAIINSAYIMHYDELNNLVADLRIGVNLNCIKNSYENLNKLAKLTLTNQKDIMSQTELKDLAIKAKNIIKGE